MPTGLKPYIVRVFSLLMALYFLNFSVDAPVFYAPSENSGSPGAGDGESLLEMVLEVDIEIENIAPSTEDAKKEMEKESSFDSTDFLHHRSQKLAILNFHHSFLSSLHKPCSNLHGRAQDITSPPPRANPYFA